MTLENFKRRDFLLRGLMAAIFISAGIFRLFNAAEATGEMLSLGLPAVLSWLMCAFEIIAGTLLLANGRYFRSAVLSLIIFLALALFLALMTDAPGLWHGAKELFVFNVEPTDFFLHSVFIIILISLILKKDD
ncbi:MAG: DoxX family membrane protein [Bacillota bacterium]